MSKRDVHIEKMSQVEAKDDVRAKYKEEMKKLSAPSKLVVAKLDEIKSAGEDTWQTSRQQDK